MNLRPLLAAFGILCLGACADVPETSSAAPDPATRVALAGQGPLIGTRNAAGGHSWLGIPFAAPPTGELRWRAPAPIEPWDETREALRAGSPCIQYGSPLGGVGEAGSRQGSEDCLYLNVYAPALEETARSSSRLPVMVWIHGGGNTVGHAAFYDGSVLAAREGVIVVTVNYRLGPFGWFMPPAGATDDPEEASGNYGNLDVLAALRWVQRHASAFGGDAENVTVFGESAGGTNALALLVMPAAQGLLDKMIIQSLGFGFSPIPQDDSPMSTRQILERLLVTSGRAASAADAPSVASSMSPAAQLAFLRSVDPWTVYGAYRPARSEWDRIPTVFQDGHVLRRGEVRDLLADPATHLDVPVILGTNRDEPKIFMAFDPRHVRRFAGLPVALRDPAGYDREARYRARLWTADGVDSIADRLAEHGAPAFAYRWDWDEQGEAFGLIDLSRIVGAAHGLEIPFVLGTFDLGPQSELLFHDANAPARLALSERMMAYWAQFARTGTPNADAPADPTFASWLPWAPGPTGARRLVFDTPSDGGIRMESGQLTRESVVAEMARETLSVSDRCALFQATFRNADDPWADAAWRNFQDGACVGTRLTSRLSAE